MKPILIAYIFSALLSQSIVAQELAPSSVLKDDCTECVAMSTVTAGTYQMGKSIDYGYGDMDGPTHEVKIKQSFSVATAEVTVAEFRNFTQQTGHISEGVCNVYTTSGITWHIDPIKNWENPGFPQEENHPVVCVSWDDTQAYIK